MDEEKDKPADMPEQHSDDWVDLGLSVKWATFNVGATKPEEFGDYYAWGETEPKTEYSWDTYKWGNGEENSLTKYNSAWYYDRADNKITLDLEDDVAYVKLGGNGRMPSKAEWDELCNYCTWEWYEKDNSEYGGVAGFKVTGKKAGYTDRSIFLPAAGGYRWNEGLYAAGFYGFYWSSSRDDGYNYNIYSNCLRFNRSDYLMIYDERYDGYSVRPVCPSEDLSVVLDSTNLTLSWISKLRCRLNAKVILRDEELNRMVTWKSDNESVAVVDQEGWVSARSIGVANIIATYGGVSATCKVTVTEHPFYENGYEYVDLGLSVRWASYNVGAEKLEEYGNHYAWGELEPKEDYSFYNYRFYAGGEVIADHNSSVIFNSSYVELSKYNDIDNKIVLDPEDDVAHVKWGGNWRMPTTEEWDELMDSCIWEQFSMNGVEGYRIYRGGALYSPDDPFIFLPCTGTMEYNYFNGSGVYVASTEEYPIGAYWASNRPSYSYLMNLPLNMRKCYAGWGGWYYSWGYRTAGFTRACGLAVRPVCP